MSNEMQKKIHFSFSLIIKSNTNWNYFRNSWNKKFKFIFTCLFNQLKSLEIRTQALTHLYIPTYVENANMKTSLFTHIYIYEYALVLMPL